MFIFLLHSVSFEAKRNEEEVFSVVCACVSLVEKAFEGGSHELGVALTLSNYTVFCVASYNCKSMFWNV